MGQAKRRGTYEQRVQQAIAENKALQAKLKELTPAPTSTLKHRRNHRLAAALVATIGVQSYKVKLQQNGQFKRKEQ